MAKAPNNFLLLVEQLGKAQQTARLLQTVNSTTRNWEARDEFAGIARRIDHIIRDLTTG